ncbi:MAG: hypothetical protein KBA75_00040 [Alphaproteobacteria bacterium]|nr:hypothetical protein [Alphaproteobacteria bacterium]
MLSEVRNVTAGYPAVGRADAAAPAAKPSKVENVAVQADAKAAAAAQNAAPTSPLITVDPRAGVILQFLDSKGQVESQSPTFAAVAYLRAGLTRDGYTKDADAEADAAPDTTTIPSPITA